VELHGATHWPWATSGNIWQPMGKHIGWFVFPDVHINLSDGAKPALQFNWQPWPFAS